MSYENPSTQPDRDLDQDLPTRRELDLEDEIDALESYAGKLEREVTELEIALDSSQSYVSWLESQLIPMSLKLIEIYEREREPRPDGGCTVIDWANAVSELGALAIVLLGFALFVWASYIKDPPLFVPFKMHKEVVDGLTKELDKRDTVIGEQKREIKQQNVDFVRVTSELARQGDIFSRFVDALRTSQREGG